MKNHKAFDPISKRSFLGKVALEMNLILMHVLPISSYNIYEKEDYSCN
jgi:hypothetical protein